ncbi:MAG: 3-hydroxyacyl-[acyl-carrier-protein] dehydratase FabZ [Chlamydiae bacterium]|nr:3-hydroxyacyl-[acyl-carrier-protein] dehydratase FabZ [Chlamydiota bacterium]
MDVSLNNPSTKTLIGIKEILDILPHRYPFLLVDKVVSIDLEKNIIVAQKNVTFNEEFFQGHFPGAPIMPGVLLLEALAQTGGILVHQKGFTNKSAVILNVNQAKFRSPVKPGDILLLHAEGLHVSARGGRIKGRAMIGDKVAVEAELGFALRDKNQI